MYQKHLHQAHLFKTNYIEYYVVHGSHEYVEYILNKIVNKRNSNLYDYAIQNNDIRMISTLLRCDVNISLDAAAGACRVGNYDALKLLIDNGALLDEYTFTVAIKTDNMNILRLLFENGCPMDDSDYYVVRSIIEQHN